MFSYRAVAGIGAAVLALLALSKVNKNLRNRIGKSGGSRVKKAAGRVKGIIRRRMVNDINVTGDVI